MRGEGERGGKRTEEKTDIRKQRQRGVRKKEIHERRRTERCRAHEEKDMNKRE